MLTHDSIGLGEDGPTHQPVEHLAACRAIPGLLVFRPGDANEVAETYRTAIAIRPDAGEIMDYFARQNVDVKIISGDNSETVSAVGQRLGVAVAERHVDLRTAGDAIGQSDVVEALRLTPAESRSPARRSISARPRPS